MSDVDSMIRRDIEDDPGMDARALTVELVHKGFFPRRHIVRISGTVKSEHEKSKIETIARHHAGDAFRVENEVTVLDHQ